MTASMADNSLHQSPDASATRLTTQPTHQLLAPVSANVSQHV